MKKKAILEIPFMQAESIDKKYKYIALQQMTEIKNEKHLLVEVFENTKTGRKCPKTRLIFTKHDWGIYYVQGDTWSEAAIRDDYGRNAWECPEDKRDTKTYMSETDQAAVWEFCGKHTYMAKERYTWTDRLQGLIDDIRKEKTQKRYAKRRERLEERIRETPELPEDLEQWAERNLFGGMHYLYYKRNGRYADICCSSCGGTATKATKRTDSFEGQFESVIPVPREGETGICPICGAKGTWKAKGKTRGCYALDKYFYVAQSYKESGAVIRYIQAEKIWTLEEAAADKGTEMIGAGERFIITEIARRYLEKDKRPHTDFKKCSPYTGMCFWDDCNLDSMGHISISEGMIYEKSYQMLGKTDFKYSAADIYNKSHRKFNLMNYMQRYQEYPQIEMFVKAGLTKIVARMVDGYCGFIKNEHAADPADFLGINRERMKLLIEKQGDSELLEAMKLERRMEAHWTEKELNMVRAAGINHGDVELALRYMSMRQLVNRIEKYAGIVFREDSDIPLCGRAEGKIREIKYIYFDYMHMREQAGYDLHNTIFLFPRDLQAEHEKMVQELNKQKHEKRDREVMEKYPNIKKAYRRLRNRYFFEMDELRIRPARDAAEIVREGRTLHHCVGGDNYLKKHNEEDSIILFLRLKELDETPYITVEIRDTRIVQWYGAFDKKPEKEKIDWWLAGYVKHLKEAQDECGQKIKETA